ncbi:DUF4234 domain-containing protein [Allostreptomyces psammosilenae]|uniref:DUF4234 domain-containing protein n=1 Tax=Allostreptomyces psammosilenae TaxID=1892865 RepID=A0A852ZS87_9ACTN|nr:DUF4234 domain-containing protein [Allostreptomyces psammosilenae]NYI04140.1 hypothetical protein [Allostreptomyces psammosilenae]
MGGPVAAGPIGKVRNPFAVWLLSCITLGIYQMVWYYRINRELRDFAGVQVAPGRAVLAITIGGFVLVPPFVSIANTGGRIARAQEFAGVQQRCSGGVGVLLLFVLSLTSVYYQSQLNDLWRSRGASG